jgi:hypothetical protein
MKNFNTGNTSLGIIMREDRFIIEALKSVIHSYFLPLKGKKITGIWKRIEDYLGVRDTYTVST